MGLQQDIDELKTRAAVLLDEAARQDRVLSREEDTELLRMLEKASLLEHELSRTRRKPLAPAGSV